MHETGLCEAILDAVERRAKGRRVTGVKVRIGTLHAVSAPALAQSFELVSAGSVADGAVIDLVPVDGDTFVLESIRLAEGTGDVPRHPG
ncbi:hydrogenase maturation nickel metallochaperone HypA [Streptomyces sp. TRM66268-LWL]|uniref:Hydrogenase maturation nickel metallochaperone HypA n=1 Tax=Streptomyces polyasparticus TaxID=2767826 RepID=A0ABR7SEK9_9ACTN|nr:hydrogenase maturation nickel metallochaperone HypA [Streptomyces polyasparticus]MBC9713930.1 hydrogenase maturation nickel metallochaperone HypA [Streptomyces polyasparticus]